MSSFLLKFYTHVFHVIVRILIIVTITIIYMETYIVDVAARVAKAYGTCVASFAFEPSTTIPNVI